MSSLGDFHLILEKRTDALSGSSPLPHSPVLQKSSYHFFVSVLCLRCGVPHGWLVAARAWPWGAGQGGRRHPAALPWQRGWLCPSPPHELLGAGWILPLPTPRAAGLCWDPAQHHPQLRGSPQESMGLPAASPSSWPWQMPLLCAGCLLRPALLAALPLPVLLGFFACPRHCVPYLRRGDV